MTALLPLILLVIVRTAASLVRDEPADLAAGTLTTGSSLMLDSAITLEKFRSRPDRACDWCQPTVNVPGFETQWDVRGGRTEVVLSLLDRMDVGTLSSVARWIAARGLAVDYRTPNRAQAVQVSVSMRWRIDAFGAPFERTE